MLEINKLLNELGQEIVIDAKGDTAVDTGALKASIKYKVSGDKLILSQLEYGMYQKPNELEVSIEKVLNRNIDKITDALINQILE